LYDWISGTRKILSWRLFTFALLAVATVLTISKAGIIILGILCFWLMLQQIIIRKWWKIALPGFAVIIGVIIGVAYLSPRVASRFQEIPKAFSSVKSSGNKDVESNAARIIMWSTSVKVIQSNWILGTGTGDGNTEVAEKKLNSHNQFLNSWVQLGAFGFVFLFGIFISSFGTAIRNGSLPVTLMTVAFLITMLFESFVETQGGIIPFCLLMAVLNQRAVKIAL
jgi:O-antigen ligase